MNLFLCILNENTNENLNELLSSYQDYFIFIKDIDKHNISLYLGRDLCRFDFHTPGGELIYDETIKPLLFFEAIDEIFRSKKNIRAIINFIKYKQSFIVSTICIERVNSKLLEYSKIIKMNHIFERNAICRIISEIKSPK